MKLRKERKSNPGQQELTKERVLKEVEHHVDVHVNTSVRGKEQ